MIKQTTFETVIAPMPNVAAGTGYVSADSLQRTVVRILPTSVQDGGRVFIGGFQRVF